MCGITGIYHRREGAPDPQVLDRMTDSMVHRGPDGRGVAIAGGVGFGHRRLAIIGLSDGAQPMMDEEGSVCVTFNGEIYNYLDLKGELEAAGYRFRTRSDTEVLVHGYRHWGEDLVLRLRGIFAFVIHDRTRDRLFGARDHLGVKPLYYHCTPDLFLFGSEAKALLAHPDMPRRPDLDGVKLALVYGYVPAPYTAFHGMRQLEPGTRFTVDAERWKSDRYWTPPFFGTGDDPPDDEELDRLVDETVGIELMSEVPLGAFLSGGIDSSIVAASMARNPSLESRPRTFCIGFPEPQYDESPYSRRVAEHLDLNHHVETMSIGSLGLLDRLVGVYDEPFFDSSAIPTYALCEMARRHVTVALSGDGGDELFAGYKRYAQFAKFRELIRPLRALSGVIGNTIPIGGRGQIFFSMNSKTLAEQYDRHVQVFPGREVRAWLEPDLQQRVPWSLADLYERAEGETPVQRAQWVDVMSYLPGDILTKVDRASMAHSLEVRVPLLDYRFYERVASLPVERTFGSGRLKVALKEHLARRMPRELVERPKKGFGVPLEFWTQGPGGLGAMAAALRARHPKGRFYSPVKPAAVDEILDRHGRRDLSYIVWSILFLETWWQRHFV